jgi:Papain family cysteine protease
VWDYAKDQGGLVGFSSHLAYNAMDTGACVSGLSRQATSQVDYWIQIPQNAEAMKCRLVKYGPILGMIRIVGTSAPRYKSGVFDDPENFCQNGTVEVDHAIVIVGYGTENGVDYWTVQVSLFLIARIRMIK